jgi:hypothetical protein
MLEIKAYPSTTGKLVRIVRHRYVVLELVRTQCVERVGSIHARAVPRPRNGRVAGPHRISRGLIRVHSQRPLIPADERDRFS